MRFFVSLAYDGASYSGWQRQANAVSVQEKLENALSLALGEEITVTGCGRTDAGVSASCFYAHFDTSYTIKEPRSALYKINAILPTDIVVYDIFEVAPEAHSRFDACRRTYTYRIHTCKDPFAKYSFYYKFPVDIEAMNCAAASILGKRDFSAFEKSGSDNATSICEVTEAFWKETSDNHSEFIISANRFLRNMVRATVGTLLEVGRGRHTPDWVGEVLESRDRCAAGGSVPGGPLFLSKVEYPEKIYIK